MEKAAQHLGSLDGVWHWKEAPEHLYPLIWTDDDATCSDEMNETLWQIVLNLVCNQRSEALQQFNGNSEMQVGS